MKVPYLAIFAIVFCIQSCSDSPCFNSSASVKEIELEIPEFEIITIHDYLDINIIQSDKSKAVIRGKENRLENISINSNGKELIIRDNNSCNWSGNSRTEVEIYTNLLRIVNLYNYGDFHAYDLKMDTLEFNSLRSGRDIHLSGDFQYLRFLLEKGSPDLYLSGSCENFYIYHFGSGFVFGEELIAKKMHLHHNSTGDFHVYPIEELFVELYSRGRIFYYREPQIIGGPGAESHLLIPAH
ncbi:MAG: DUF2807 domain-containing protein [Saprospirales bacterium]|nr:MAG: DUF2807 domain-containing protein [Saprospirales bacterium]